MKDETLENEESNLDEDQESEQSAGFDVDVLMRRVADAENRVKVIEREKDASVRYAVTGAMTDFLEVVDALDAAVLAVGDRELSGEAVTLRDGLKLTRSLTSKVFNKHGVEEVRPNPGDEFDHDVHQAVSQEESAEYPEGVVLSCMRAGYTLKGRLLRPAFVILSKISTQS